MAIQRSTARCDVFGCARVSPVEPEPTGYEFRVVCPVHGHSSTISWAHSAPAPTFDTASPAAPMQARLGF